MANILDEVIAAASDIKSKRDQIVIDATVLRALVQGPSSGGSSTVDTGGEAGVIKTLARVLAESAGRVGLQYRFAGAGDTTVHPGAGNIVVNNADWSAITEIAVAAADVNGLNQAGALADADASTTLLNRAQILIQTLDGATTVVLRVTGATVAGSGFYRLAVAKRSATGTISTSADVAMLIVPTGDRGGNNYEVTGSFPGDALPAGGEHLIWHGYRAEVLYAANLPGWLVASRTPPEEDAVYLVKRFSSIADEIGTVLGSATLMEGELLATFSAGEFTCGPGQFLAVCAPDPPVAGISDLYILTIGTQVIP
jgi:hypothetical protein